MLDIFLEIEEMQERALSRKQQTELVIIINVVAYMALIAVAILKQS